MHIDILSLFPEYFRGPLDESILKRAQQAGILSIDLVDIRKFSQDLHRRADDRPYGGGPGMVMLAQPVVEAVRAVKRQNSRVVYLSPQGTPLTAKISRRLSQEEHLILLCGHYEGIDQRALDLVVDEEISIGDYVLTNGCLAAIVLLDTFARFIPGVLGHEAAADEDSFEGGLLDCPHYTRPEFFEGLQVPAVLLSGDHRAIGRWRTERALEKTREVREDLYHLHMSGKVASEEGSKQPKLEVSWFRAVLSVQELAVSKKFYGKALGLSVLGEGQGFISFALSGGELRLIEEKRKKVEKQSNGWLELHVNDTAELEKLTGRLVRLEVPHKRICVEGRLKEVHVKDLDDNCWVVKLN